MIRSLLLILFFSAAAIAQSDYQEQVAVNAVNVSLVARDENGKIVKDLTPKEITVFENGIKQSVIDILSPSGKSTSRLTSEDVPLSVTFALDTSSSMGSMYLDEKRMEIAKKAILMLMDALSEGDQMALAPFGRFPKSYPPMSQNKKEVEDQVLIQKPIDSRTAIFDSLSEMLDDMAEISGRKILVLCTDGEDNASKMDFNSFLQKLGASDVLVLAFTIPSGEKYENQYVIEKIANITGGFAFFPTTASELDEIVQQLRRTMQSQYSIWYRPSNNIKDGNWRTIQVLCHRPGIEVHYRPGYFAR